MNQPFTSLVAAQKFDLDRYQRQAGTPAHKLLEGGANPADEKVKGVVTTEGGFLGAVHTDEHMTGRGVSGNVNKARGEYKGALGALPTEVRERIGAGNIDEAVGTVESDFRRELQRTNGRGATP